jgi:outer membrane protein OmpA-like peptidoglycan-associated protein
VQAMTFSGKVLTDKKVFYSLLGQLPLGLRFSTSNGYISGIVNRGADLGIYKLVVTAYSIGYESQQLAYNLVVLGETLTPSPNPSPVPPITDPLTITFTDITLNDAEIGKTYRDYVKAQTYLGNNLSNARVTYALTGNLPPGLVFTGNSGYVTGTVSKDAKPALYQFIISAFSKGYLTEEYLYQIRTVGGVPSPSPDPTPSNPTLMSTVWFNSGKSTLLPSTKLLLDQFLKTYTGSKFSKITVNGYTDGQLGMNEYLLSKARAEAVGNYLLSKNSNLAIVTFGLSLAPESKVSTKSIQASRKVEIWVS